MSIIWVRNKHIHIIKLFEWEYKYEPRLLPCGSQQEQSSCPWASWWVLQSWRTQLDPSLHLIARTRLRTWHTRNCPSLGSWTAPTLYKRCGCSSWGWSSRTVEYQDWAGRAANGCRSPSRSCTRRSCAHARRYGRESYFRGR